MERVDHIDVIEVSCCSLVCNVNGMFEWEVPHREGLEFCISGLLVALVLVVELAKTNSHLSASGTRGSNHYERLCGLDKVILSESLIRVDESHVVRISVDGVVVIYLDAEALQSIAVCDNAGLSIIVGDHHAAYVETDLLELSAESENVLVLCDTKVTSDLVLFDIQ